jgi:formylmethanofuran dehydrogenase subunit A
VHSSNLGLAGNVDSTLGTIRASEGLPIHLTHIQFHSYGTEGDRKFSSAAARVAEAINATPNASCDVGQVLFGQTVTASGDSMSQSRNSPLASPGKFVLMDIECDAGCGVVPFKYRERNFVNALQWAIGLEIFLLVSDPWRVFLTTDHPNGAPFTSYPHLIRLLMDRSFRNERLAMLHPDAQAMTTLGSIDREYTLYEIAILTRAAPARILGLPDLGRLGPGACADIAVYRDEPDRERMFTRPEYVFKDGELVVQDGRVVKVSWGRYHAVQPAYDKGIERRLREHFARYHTIRADHLRIDDEEMAAFGHGAEVVRHPCRR